MVALPASYVGSDDTVLASHTATTVVKCSKHGFQKQIADDHHHLSIIETSIVKLNVVQTHTTDLIVPDYRFTKKTMSFGVNRARRHRGMPELYIFTLNRLHVGCSRGTMRFPSGKHHRTRIQGCRIPPSSSTSISLFLFFENMYTSHSRDIR